MKHRFRTFSLTLVLCTKASIEFVLTLVVASVLVEGIKQRRILLFIVLWLNINCLGMGPERDPITLPLAFHMQSVCVLVLLKVIVNSDSIMGS